jgi:hypothetical protein
VGHGGLSLKGREFAQRMAGARELERGVELATTGLRNAHRADNCLRSNELRVRRRQKERPVVKLGDRTYIPPRSLASGARISRRRTPHESGPGGVPYWEKPDPFLNWEPIGASQLVSRPAVGFGSNRARANARRDLSLASLGLLRLLGGSDQGFGPALSQRQCYHYLRQIAGVHSEGSHEWGYP